MTRRYGITLVETLMVIVLLAAISPVLAHLLTTASASHADAVTRRGAITDATFAIETAGVRLRAALSDPDVTITEARHDAVTFSDGTFIELTNGELIVGAPGLPDGVLAEGITAFAVSFSDAAGTVLDPTLDTFDEADVARISLGTTTADDLTVSDRLYREGTRTYKSTGAHEGVWFEDFTDVPNNATSDDGDTAWSTELDGHDQAVHGVSDGRYGFSFMRPKPRPVTWRSESIDISSLGNAVLSMSLDGWGSLDAGGSNGDTLEIAIIVDDVRTVVCSGVGNEPVGLDIESAPFSGSRAEIEVRAFLSGGDEHYTVDDVLLTERADLQGLVIFAEDEVVPVSPGGQDGQGRKPTSFAVLDEGRTMRVEGNAWKAIPFEYSVTEHTVMEFDFRTSVLGEIHTICFDNNTRYNGFELRDGPTPAGTQTSHGLRSPHVEPYDLSGDWVHYVVNIGDVAGTSVRKDWTFLCVICDDDRNGAGVSEFRNVQIYEAAE